MPGMPAIYGHATIVGNPMINQWMEWGLPRKYQRNPK